MDIVITGGAGFLGSWIADSLLKEDHKVITIDDLSGGFATNVGRGISFEKLDLASWRAPGLMRQAKPEVLYHLAANAREGASHFCPADVTRRNMMAFANAIEGAIAGGRLKRVVLFSSMARYGEGDPEGPPFPETNRVAPEDIYAANKGAMEKTVEVLADVHDFEYVIVIPHNVFGERQCLSDPQRNVLAIWMNSIMRGEPVLIFGDGCQTRAFSYIGNSLPCYLKCLTMGASEAINIGGERPVTINEAAELVVRAMEPEYKNVEIKHIEDRPREVKHAFCTIEKSQELLGYDEKISFEDGIKRMSRWAKGLGARRWISVTLPLQNAKMPRPWNEDDPLFRGGISRRGGG